MPQRFFHEEYSRHPEQKAHMSIMDGDKAVELPIVGGVIKIPDELVGKVVLPPGWTKYVGQVPSSDPDLVPITDVDAHYNGAKKK